MSHFTVAVITDKIENLEGMLAPYDENMVVKPYIDQTKEELLEEAKERKTRYEKDLKESGLDYKEDSWKRRYIEAKTDEELLKVDIEEMHEDEKFDENNNHLTTYNPDSRWDWYSIGGRWRNLLLTKIDNEDVISEKSLEDLMNGESNLKKDTPEGYKWVDGARIKDIDFKKAMEFRDKYNKAIRFWETYVEGQEPKTEEERENIKFECYKREYYIERYGTKEKYAKSASTFTCWALLDETGWHEKGKMGWWAMSDSTKESEELFEEKFTETINKHENQNKYLIIVDCHI